MTLTRVPFPQQLQLWQGAAQYAAGGDKLTGSSTTGGGSGSSAGSLLDSYDTAAAGYDTAADGSDSSGSSIDSGSSSSSSSSSEEEGEGRELGRSVGTSEVGSSRLCYYSDLLRAHRALGLLQQVSLVDPTPTDSGGSSAEGRRGAEGTAWCFVSLGEWRDWLVVVGCNVLFSMAVSVPRDEISSFHHLLPHVYIIPNTNAPNDPAPRKDCEVFVLGSHMGCRAFQSLLHAALRALIDGLGLSTFNAAVLNVDPSAPHPQAALLDEIAELCSSEGGGSGSSGISSISVSEAAGEAAEAGSRLQQLLKQRRLQVAPLSADDLWVPPSFPAARPPVVARLVSRGKLDGASSDFGGLEVFGGASIGHTDPYRAAAAIQEQLGLMKQA